MDFHFFPIDKLIQAAILCTFSWAEVHLHVTGHFSGNVYRVTLLDSLLQKGRGLNGFLAALKEIQVGKTSTPLEALAAPWNAEVT